MTTKVKPTVEKMEKIIASYVHLKCVICHEPVNMLPGDKQSMKPAHIFCSMWGHSIDEHNYKTFAEHEWSKTLRQWYKEKKITKKKYITIKHLLLQAVNQSVQEAKAEEADKWKARLEQSNSLLRSTFSIAERDGRQTNWEPFRRQVEKELKLQHKLRDRLNTKDDLLTSLRKERGEA